MGGRFAKAAVLLFSLAVFASCGGGGSGSGGQAQLRFVNASPNEGEVKILLDGTIVANNINYESSSGYLGMSSGSHTIQVNLVGTSTGVLTVPVSVSGGTNYTLMMDNFASQLGHKMFTDSNSAPATGNFRIRFINESPSMGSVDVYLVPAGDSLAGQTPINIVGKPIPFEGDTGYSPHASGSYQIYFTSPGTTFAYIATTSLAFSGGQTRTIVALNSTSGGYTSITLKDINN